MAAILVGGVVLAWSLVESGRLLSGPLPIGLACLCMQMQAVDQTKQSSAGSLAIAHDVHTTGWKAAPVLVNRADPSPVQYKIDAKGDSIDTIYARHLCKLARALFILKRTQSRLTASTPLATSPRIPATAGISLEKRGILSWLTEPAPFNPDMMTTDMLFGAG